MSRDASVDALPSFPRRLAALAAVGAEVAVGIVAVVALFARPLPVLLSVLTVLVATFALGLFALNRGLARWLGAALLALSITAAAALLVWGQLVWVLIAIFLLGALAMGFAVFALRIRPYRPPERRTPPPSQPFFLMNRWSGGGKVEEFGLDELARSKGAEVVMLEKGMDVVATVEAAVASGADLLGAAGGDGTQALVAQVATEHDVPMIVVPAGTRNHFALDLGLDRDDPRAAIEALGDDGVEIRVDLGSIADRTFVNNVSLGVYPEIVANPEYRGAKLATALQTLPDAAAPGADTGLLVTTPDERTHSDPQLIQVGNNQYEYRGVRTVGTRPRLDTGMLGVEVIDYDDDQELAHVIAALASDRTIGAESAGLVARWTSLSITIEAACGTVSAGVDGEHLELPSPLEIASRPGALRVRVPDDRPGLPAALPTRSLDTLRSLWAVARGGAG